MKSGNDDEITVDIESLVKDILTCRQRSKTANKRSWSKITRLNEYKPDAVCIGPYYNDQLHSMEAEKRAVLLGILPGDEQQKADMLTRLANAVNAVESEARDYYADRANRMRSPAFVRMLVLDGCYIVGKFVVPDCCPCISEAGTDGAGSKKGVAAAAAAAGASQSGRTMQNIALVRDVFYLLGNQIPFCVLDVIHRVLHGPSSPTTAVAVALARHLRDLLQQLGYSVLHVGKPSPWHLLHLLHMHFQPSELQHEEGGSSKILATKGAGHVGISCAAISTVYRWRQATQYHAAGVKLKKRHLGDAAHTILDIKLDGLTLHVPSLTVDNNTCRILRNLMALEQLNPEELGSHVTAYCLFMSQFACTASDVELLVKKGIIVHALRTDSDVADRLASLCSGIIVDLDEPQHNYLHRVRKDLERMYGSRKVNCLTLPHRNPWLVVALFAAVVVLFCQLLQAIYSTKSYYRSLHDLDVPGKFGKLT